jgi:heme exporter protein C
MAKLILKQSWWKVLAVALLAYTIWGSLLFAVPRLPILNETIRLLHFHVPMWFGMILLLLLSVVYAIKYLNKGRLADDRFSVELANMGLAFGVLGLLSGMVWAKFTWGDYWSGDPKQTASAIGMLIYLGYFVLRSALPDDQQKGRLSAVYNIFAFAALIPLLFILPRLTDSLHPGNGGNPGFNAYDLDSSLRAVFYPAVLGWFLLGLWLASLRIRQRLLLDRLEDLI